MPENKILYLIDATAFCYRAFYAVKGLSTSFGQPTNAVFGFVNMLNKVIKEHNPKYLGICFDVSRDTFRQKKYLDYKIQRAPMPDGLVSQMPLIRQLINAYGFKVLERDGFEADDVIATVSSKAAAAGIKTVIVSSDKDILQLVNDNIHVYSPYKDQGVLYDTDKVIERFGIQPSRIPDLIALMGDDVDNIPGAKGIGEKTATELIKTFGSLDNLLSNVEKVKQEKLRSIIKRDLDIVKLSRELAVLDADMEMDFSLDDFAIGSADNKELFRIFKYLEFKSFLKELPDQDPVCGGAKFDIIQDSDILARLAGSTELFLCGDKLADLVYSCNGAIFKVDNPQQKTLQVLQDQEIKKTGHDLKKIKVALSGQGINLQGLDFDIMLAAYLLNPSKSDYGVGDLALDYLSQGQITKADDCVAIISLVSRLKPILEQELISKSLIKLFRELDMPLASVLADMEIVGIKLDLQAFKGLSTELEDRLIKLIDEIYAISECQFNINSPKQLREILFDRLKLPIIKRSKTGPSTDEEVLRRLADKHPLPALLLEYRQLTKLKNTYVDVMPALIDQKSGHLHTNFNQAATETGRLSSSNPNLQNIPVKTDIGRRIRGAIIAFDSDSSLVSFDYSQVELRILAHLSGDEHLVSAFALGKDIHRFTASLINNLEEQDVDDLMRDMAKRVNFGIIYGLSSYGLSRDLRISVEDAQSFIDSYFTRYPKVKEYIDKQIKFAESQGFVETLLGRRRYIPQINEKSQMLRQLAQRQAVNTPIQGTASDLIKQAMVEIYNKIKGLHFRSQMILQIHDELLFNVYDDEEHKLIALVRERMENVIKLCVPLRVDIKKGRDWLNMEDLK